jgi:amino acid adenylation domain-containing protein/non-ribosomal peptide synthase protein (TIGR01720 family)
MSSKTGVYADFCPRAETSPHTLVDLLRRRAVRQADLRAYTFLADGEAEEISLTYGELDRRARAIAVWLQPLVPTGERVLLLYPQGLDYIAAFFGCLYAGAIAVPAYPPRRNRNMLRLQAVATDAQATVALTTNAILAKMAPLFSQNPYLEPLRWLTTDSIPAGIEEQWQEPAVAGDTLAFLQYTSGSTSTPKGVMLSHGNLLHNEQMLQLAFQQSEGSTIVGWLPLYHDMGLIGNVLQPLFVGATCVLMSPMAFLQRPFLWLRAISRYGATTSGGPNFAYDLCTRKINDEQRGTLDLSGWSVAFNGAEPIRHETLEKFTAAFEPCGFRREAFRPCYGLAEATLLVTGRADSRGMILKRVEAGALEINRVVEAAPGEEGARVLVGCGETLLGQEVLIADPEALTRCRPDEVGEIWVSGPSVAQGYWNREEETGRTFHAYLADADVGPFLRTGDLGFLENGELFVTGRLKDLIIIRGRNHYPQDIERTVEECHAALRPGCGAAFAVEVAGEERLIVVQEVDHRRHTDFGAVITQIRQAVSEEHEVQVHAVELIKPGTIPKTSSGKIQRHACRAAFLERSLEAVAEWRDVASAEAAVDALPPPRGEEVKVWLRATLAARLGVAPGEIDTGRPVTRYGLDSLTAIELMHDIEAKLGISLPVTTFLQSHSIGEIASAMREQLAVAAAAPHKVVLSPSHDDATEHPLSRGQQALWFLHQLAPESAVYNIISAVRILSEPDLPALGRAFQGLINRHRSLRTTFTVADGKPLQHVHENISLPLHEEDAAGWSEETLERRLVEEAHRPFDLAQGPLLRVSIFRRAAGEHILLLTIHHIVADFWSLGVMMQELGALYRCERDGSPATLAPLPLHYTDYVRWQEEMLSGPEGEHLWAYWHKQLGGELPVLNLHTDRPRPPVQTYRGSSLTFEVSADTLARLKALGQRHGATLYMTLLAAFQALLHRYTGQPEIVVGSPTAGRDWVTLSGLVGYFVNPIALRANLSDDPTFETFLGQVRRTVLEGLEHRGYPFPLLVERLQLARVPSHSPLFQAMFVMQRTPAPAAEELAVFALNEQGARMNLGGLLVESHALERQVAQFDLTLTVTEAGDRLLASLKYNTDLFDAATAERMAGNFQTLLAGAAAEPARRVSQLPLLSAGEERQLLTEWNDTAAPRPAERCLHRLFEEQAARTPGSVAIVSEGRRLTYGELSGRADRLARRLRESGVGPEKLVGVFMERSAEAIVALLGVLKAGGAYVPLDPSYPSKRLDFMLRDAKVCVLLTQPHLRERLPASAAPVLCLDADGEAEDREGQANPQDSARPENLAYVIYTSGSTGEPKGVMITHRAICNHLLWRQKAQPLTEEDAFLQKASISFDISVWEIFATLLAGARLVLTRPGMQGDSAYLVRLMAEERITCAHFGPQMLRAVLEEPGLDACPSLRRVVCGGEPLSVELQERFHARLGAELHSQYGPTEATVDATSMTCRRGQYQRVVPIGSPIDNTQIYLLDRQLRPVPVGVTGEVHIGGYGLARGYLDRPGLTAERFIPDPFGARPGARLYRTGDLARHLPDGSLEFVGRADGQVKVRGYRVELGEIEAALRQHAALADAAVIVWEGAPGDRRLVAYVVAAGDAPPTTSELRDYLKRKLPEYMLPAAFMTLDRLPLTPTAKVDRRALPAPDHSRPELAHEFTAPRSAAEETLARIWSEVLLVERVGVHDNFFELGGDSILSIQIVARAIQAGLRLTPQQMFQHQTIAELAALAVTSAASRSQQTAVVGDVPLTAIQRRFFEECVADPHHYNQTLMMEVRRHLNADTLRRALARLLEHHDALRLRFSRGPEGWAQFNAERESNEVFEAVDLSALPEGAQGAALEEAAEKAQRSLNLSEGPLMRAVLFNLGAGRPARLLLLIHHLAVDGISWRILLEDLESAYAQLTEGATCDLGLKTASYKQWAEGLTRYAASGTLEQQLSYWLDPSCRRVSPIPVDYGGGANTVASARRVEVELDADETRQLLQKVPAALHAQINEVLLTALLLAQRSWSGTGCLLLDLEGHGREEAVGGGDLSRTVGWFTSVYPLRLELAQASAPAQALKEVKEQMRRIPDKGVGYGVLRYLSGEANGARLRDLPRAEVSFNYLGQFDQVLLNSSLFKLVKDSGGLHQSADARRRYLLDIVGSVAEGRLHMSWTYSGQVHRRASIERLAAEFVAALRSLLAHSQSAEALGFSPSDFPLAGLDQTKLNKLSALLNKKDRSK